MGQKNKRQIAEKLGNIVLIPLVIMTALKACSLIEALFSVIEDIISGIPFAYLIRILFNFKGFGGYLFICFGYVLAYGLLTLCVAKKKKNILLLGGAFVLLIVQFVEFIRGFFTYTYFVNDQDSFNVLTVLPRLVGLLIPFTLLVLVLAYFLKVPEKTKKLIGKAWFIPALFVFLKDVMVWIVSILCMLVGWEWSSGILSYSEAYGYDFLDKLAFLFSSSQFEYFTFHLLTVVLSILVMAGLGAYLWGKKKESIEE